MSTLELVRSIDIVGWDIGGAHLKACLRRGGEIVDVAQWACPLWQGLEQLDTALDAATTRWPGLPLARHAVTMTGEMADLFANHEEGVRRIAAQLLRRWPAERVRFYAGDAGWCDGDAVAATWPHIASANWLATARHVAAAQGGDGVLVDIGSTTTDLIAFSRGRVLATARSDAERLATGELVYHGVVRTPLCALAPRIAFRGVPRNVMNEFFATTADVYRLSGELPAEHDLQPAADQGAKDAAATRQRLARMIGLDARDASADEWLQFAFGWRVLQVESLRGELQKVMALHRLSPQARLVSAGCGDFLVSALQPAEGGATMACVRYADAVAHAAPALAAQVQVCAPSVAVAMLFDQK